jgi:protein-S-isoprenylcysteine O-methyltransferase Ste14
MRFAFGTFGSALVLFVSAAVGVLGSWALVSGAVALLVAGISSAIAMEERDLRREARLLDAL